MWIAFKNGALDVCEIQMVGKRIILKSTAISKGCYIEYSSTSKMSSLYNEIIDAVQKGSCYL
ncbi:MAG: hypothetical protein IKX57_03940, partial [Oscillospiraceae bacterium]|nr:hypothetical protein [Oscillospiraceae bacterium]